MTDLKLQPGEDILLQTRNAGLYDENSEINIDELYLTNKNLIFVRATSSGASASQPIVQRIPLNSLATVNGSAQVEIVNDGFYGTTIQLAYKTGGQALLEISESPRKLYPLWKNGITNAVRNLDSATGNAGSRGPQAQASANSNVRTVFCNQCGKKTDSSARFCTQCGAPIYVDPSMAGSTPKQPVDSIIVPREERRDKRNIVYEGTLHKCPNCGEALSSFVARCPSCGYEIRDTKPADSVSNLAKKLDAIEAKEMPPFQRKRSLMKALVGKDLNDKDEEAEAKREFEIQKIQQKVTLIINFPIPNTREDILELIILSASNINSHNGMEVSRAWREKMDQAYEKAKITMGDTPEFAQIKSIYTRKLSEFKNRKFKRIAFILFGVTSFAAFLCFCMFMADAEGPAVLLLLVALGTLSLGILFTIIYNTNKNRNKL